MRPLHDPAFHAIEDALGEIAPIRRASLRFGKYSSRYNEILAGRATNIFDCHMASGSLMDIGVYTVEPMVEIFGMPSGIASMTTLLDPATQKLTHGPIDGCGSILASYGGGRISVELAHSKITNDLLPSQIEGERGTIQIDHLSTPRNVRIDYRGDVVRGSATEAPREQDDSGIVLDLPKSNNTMEYELADFITAISGIDNVNEEIWETPAGRHELGHYRDVTLVSLRIMDAVRQQAGIAFPADSEKQA
jgi:predicted dehydrogenase